LFMTAFTNEATGRLDVSFASPYPGSIIPIDLSAYDGKIVCQKDAFLAAAKGVSVGIDFQRKLGAGFFGGDGFIMQKLEGDGMAFIHAGGAIQEKTLAPGETLLVDTGCLVALTRDVDYDIQMVRGVKTMLFGGEGLFLARLSGPGKVWVQSLPISRLASRIFAATQGQREEGSALGGIFRMFDGD
ncbi:MAG: AIM24 family protein, partial [Bacilli bacterium]